MAKLPLDLAKFKKQSSDKHSTTLVHPDGHSIVVAHKALSPKMRAQLVEMEASAPQKFESGGNVTSDKSPGINKKAAAEFVAGFNGAPEQQIKPDNGISAPGQDPHVLAQNPYMVQRAPGQGTLADRVWHAPDAQPQRQPAAAVDMEAQRPASPYAATMSQAAAEEVNNMDQVPTQPLQQYADGGEVSQQIQDSPDQIVADAQAPGGNATPAPQEDPAVANQRQRYNSIVMGTPDAKGGLPNADRAQAQVFGPNGEPPADFNADAWKQAQQSYSDQAADAKNAQDQADAQAMEQNKARLSAGVPQLPVKNPVAPPMPPGAQQTPAIQTQPNQGDPFGVNTASEANEVGLGQQFSGIQDKAQAEQAQNKALAAAQGQAAIREQQQLNDFQQNQQAIFKHHDDFMKAVQDGKIDPQHYMSNRGIGTRIAQGIGLLLGGIGQGLVGGSNPAMDYINKQIDNDIDAQKTELGKRQNLVSANLAYFNDMRQGTEMSRLMMQSVVGHQILRAAAATNNPIIAAKAKIEAGQLLQQSSQGLGQMAMKKTLLGQVNTGETTPQQEAHIIGMLAPPEQRGEAMKQLGEAQQAQSLKDDTLNAFDTIAKQQTLANRIGHPIQSKQIIDSVQNLILDKLTKDTSGRVTPETVKLVGGIFPGLATGKVSAAQARATLDNILSQGMHYPALENLNITKYSRGGAQAAIPQSAPKPPR